MEQFVRNNRGLFFTKGIRRDSYVSIYISARGSKLCPAENKQKKKSFTGNRQFFHQSYGSVLVTWLI